MKLISKTKVRNGIYAYKYADGWIHISGQKYLYYTIKEAIKKWRNQNPIK